MAKNFYDILGVSSDSNNDDIKRAYRRLAQKYHPDRNKENKEVEEKFKEINKAYEVLSDKSKREQYDRFGESGIGGGFSGSGGFEGSPFDYETFGQTGFADIFETFFGGGRMRQKQTQRRGNDMEVNMKISFEEAIFGLERKLEIIKLSSCEECDGKGFMKGSKMITCSLCQGRGEIRSIRTTILGQITTARTCEKCQGTGKIPEKICITCQGRGRMKAREKIMVKIPAGVENGTSIRLSGRGEAGIQGGMAGDLYIHIQVEPHAYWRRQGNDILGEQQIDLLQAVMGDEVEIATVHGKVTLQIPAGTQSGQVFRIKNYGVPIMNAKTKGDYLVTIQVHIPKKLSRKERDLYLQLAETKGLKLKPTKEGWLDRF